MSIPENSVERFTSRVANYVKYRPDYPREIIGYLKREYGLTPDSIVADIGCGTGISSRLFLENGNRVFGVEPNAAMRAAAVDCLRDFGKFELGEGTSEATMLEDASVDFVVAAQAFHWFEPASALAEFHRIMRPGGHIVLIWNERQINTTPFLDEYEKLLLKYARDYGNVRHENIGASRIRDFFQSESRKAVFSNEQVFDLDGLTGRMLSASYMPEEADAIYPAMMSELKTVFANHAENGKIKVLYDTRVYVCRV